MKSYQPPFFPGIEKRRLANLPEPRALNRLIAGIVFVLCPK